MRAAIVGRERELQALQSALLAEEPASARGALLEGEPGIGKTALWREALRLARNRGFMVLECSPGEGESALPYAALSDLLGPALDRSGRNEAGPLGALRAALSGEAAAEIAVARGTLEAIRGAIDGTRLLAAVDDAQWLDPPSAQALTYALRRLMDADVAVLMTRRPGSSEAVPLGLDRALGDDLRVLSVGPMSLPDLDALLRGRLAVRLARPRLMELHRACGGNPLYALEIARALADGAEAGRVTVPPRLGAALRARVAALPQPARDATLLAAACLQPGVRLVERAAGGTDGLATAVEKEILEVEGDRLRFTHPLFGSTVYEAAAPWERRDAHRRLAPVAESLQERAHQLACATEGPDEAVAAELERAAREAADRGVPESAADLAHHAVRLTSAPQIRARRELTAAQYQLAAGDPEGARSRLQRVLDELPPGPLRAEALTSLADLATSEQPAEAVRLGEQALAEAGGDPLVSANIHIALAITRWNSGEIGKSADHMRSAAALAEAAGDDLLLAQSLGELLECDTTLGLPLDDAVAARALALESCLERVPASTYSTPSFRLAVVYTALDRPDDARPLLSSELERVTNSGDEAVRWGMLCKLCDLELRVGDFGAALAAAREALDLVRLLDFPAVERFALAPYSAALANVGELEDAVEAATAALRQADEAGNRMTALRAIGVLGFVELSRGRPEAAWEILGPGVDELRAMDIGELSHFGIAHNAGEALVALGMLDQAQAIYRWIQEKGAPANRAWHCAVAQRGNALVAAERGEEKRAREHLALALEAHERLPQPFELARTLLAQGRIERRFRARAAARDALTRALELFDELGTAVWAESAAAELQRIPGRARATGELSETERRVAELVAQGLSNKEVAGRLFVTVRTVEANLTKVYAKLGLRSRTELASRLRG